MKLIEAEKVKDVIHDYFKSLMVKNASGVNVDRLAVVIGSCLKHNANLLKAIDDLPSAQPSPCEFCKHNDTSDDVACLRCMAERREDETD